MILALLPLIILAAAQECPYCRWNACTLTEGSLASCSDCHTGALVNFELAEDGGIGPVNLGICQLCPTNCNTCEYAVLPQSGGGAGLPAVKCTSCGSGLTVNAETGQCE